MAERRIPAIAIAALLAATLAAVEVPLSAPLTTIVPCADEIAGPRRIRATITVPAGAAGDLGVGAVIRDRDGRWFQVLRHAALRGGANAIDLVIDTRTPAQAHPQAGNLDLPALTTCTRSALILWSTMPGGSVDVADLRVEALLPPAATARLRDLRLDGFTAASGTCAIPCGERWTASVVPEPFPANPFDPADFRLDAVVSGPDGERRLAPFFTEDVDLSDRGDGEAATLGGRPRFDLRFRPRDPGRYRIRLEAAWGDGTARTWQLPDLVATGARVDEVVRIDSADPRFFAVDGAFHWPLGINLHSTYDKRGAEVCGTRLTPARGSLVYQAIIPRIAAAGIDTCEIWMSSWNLGLEWRADWPGFAGAGRYHLGNAERLDRVLDLAWAHGIRVNLVINNHGQASANADREWKDNPYFRANGGPIDTPEEIFAHPEALALQQRLRRYLCARYADHPAILGWKLWSEVDLTAGKGDPLIRWHEQATAAWAEADTYGHPCTTHWCGDYKHVNPGVAALPGVAYVCMDAYRGGRQVGDRWSSLPDLLANSMHDPARGLLRWNKPILATEYGAWNHAAEAMRTSDLRVAAFAALVSGHGGAPMTWWWEWVDQGERWAPFRAFRAFVDGEDLRGGSARSVALHAQSGQTTDNLWCRAWIRPGRILGHVVDTTFATRGTEPRIDGARVTIGNQVEAGRMRLVCFDADDGRIVLDQELDHPGGTLVLDLPPFRGHAAFKCWRVEDTSARPQAGTTPQASADPDRS